MATYQPLGIAATVIAGAAKLVFNTVTGVYEYVKEQKAINSSEDIAASVAYEKWKTEHGAYETNTDKTGNSFLLPAAVIGVAALLAFK